ASKSFTAMPIWSIFSAPGGKELIFLCLALTEVYNKICWFYAYKTKVHNIVRIFVPWKKHNVRKK
ncbi:hypothetical protein N8211_00475, partial [Flavobacteriaceae bacterium]|nr:hypothetical protein [Flavobacteriaceae bacterium]